MHKEIDRKEKRVYGGGMAYPLFSWFKGERKSFYEQMSDGVRNLVKQNWNLKNFFKGTVSLPGQGATTVYTPMPWAGDGGDFVNGLMGLGSRLKAFSITQLSGSINNFIKTSISAILSTGKNAFTSIVHSLSPNQRENLNKATKTTAEAMKSSPAGVATLIKQAGTFAVDTLDTVWSSMFEKAKTANSH